jgi:glyoxylase-like metal-dependent hydrolase (beta-lactamase superfamily II)
MKEIADNVFQIEGLRISNVYVLVDGDALTLVDTGSAGDADRIITDIQGAGYDPAAVTSILITHAHGDHIGGLKTLVQRLNPDVIAHRDETSYVERKASIPSSNPILRALSWVSERLPRGKDDGVKVTRELEERETLDLLGGLQVIHTPGHTPGNLCLYQADRGILFTGDLIFNGDPFTGRGGLRYPPRLFSLDPKQVKQSAQKLADMEVRILCPGHGAVVRWEPRVTMATLLKDIDT